MTQKACVRREGRRPRGEANHAERMDSFHGQGRHVGLRSAPRVEPTRPAYLRRVVYAWPSCTTVCSSSNYAPQREWRKQREAPAGLQNFQRYKFGKSLFYLLQLSPKFGFPPTTIKPGISPPSTFQTVHFTSLERF